jgi:hypothetical protein
MRRLPTSPLIARALDVAEKRLGMRELCRRLVAPETMIRAWHLGHTAMPKYKFLQLVDLLAELDPSWKDWDGAQSKA